MDLDIDGDKIFSFTVVFRKIPNGINVVHALGLGRDGSLNGLGQVLVVSIVGGNGPHQFHVIGILSAGCVCCVKCGSCQALSGRLELSAICITDARGGKWSSTWLWMTSHTHPSLHMWANSPLAYPHMASTWSLPLEKLGKLLLCGDALVHHCFAEHGQVGRL